jgi:hypothetical protein
MFITSMTKDLSQDHILRQLNSIHIPINYLYNIRYSLIYALVSLLTHKVPILLQPNTTTNTFQKAILSGMCAGSLYDSGLGKGTSFVTEGFLGLPQCLLPHLSQFIDHAVTWQSVVAASLHDQVKGQSFLLVLVVFRPDMLQGQTALLVQQRFHSQQGHGFSSSLHSLLPNC